MPTQARYSISTLASSKIDAAAGIIRDVAIMTVGDALGHGVRVDMATLQGLYSLAGKGGVKAFLNHSMMPAPTDAVGIFSGFYIDPEKEGEQAKLRATFQALRAFREHSAKDYATLFELAEIAPEAFGVSVSIYQDLEDAADGGNPYIRPTAFDSADFVSTPAANKSLFSAKTGIDIPNTTEQQTVSEKQIQASPQSQYTRHSMKAIYSKFGSNPAALAKAVKYMAENDGVSEEDAISEVEVEISAEELAALKAENEALKAQIAALTGDMSKAGEKVAELSAAAAELPAVKEALAAAQAEVASAKEQLSAATARLARYGARPIVTEKVAKEAPPVALTCTKAEFDAKSIAEKAEFSRKGGRIIE